MNTFVSLSLLLSKFAALTHIYVNYGTDTTKLFSFFPLHHEQ